MKSKLLLLVGFRLIQSISTAQNNKKSYYIYLFSGKMISAEKILIKARHIELNSEKYNFDDVKFYKDRSGVYANVKDSQGRNYFARRIKEGKLNLYEIIISDYEISTGKSHSKVNRFYNSELGDLKSASYENLLAVMKDNPLAVAQVQAAKNFNKYTFRTMMASGVLLTTSGIIAIIKANNAKIGGEFSPDYTPVLIIGCTGLALLVASQYFA